MAYTFRSGPRDPVTGRSSTVISSDNLIRDPSTGRAAQADSSGRVTGITRQEEARRRAAPAPLPAGAMTRDEYMEATGRTVKDPYGFTKGAIGRGLESLARNFGGSGVDYSGIQSLALRNAVIDRAYDKYLNPTDMQGNLRQFRPNEIALLTDPATGARFPARAQAVPRDLGVLGLLPGSGLAQMLAGPETELVPMEDSFIDTGDVREAATNIQPTFISANYEDNPLLNILPNLPRRTLQNVPEGGINQNRGGIQIGPGRLEPRVDPENRSIGLTYKIPIAQQDPQALARDQALADQDRIQLESSGAPPFLGVGPPRSVSEALARDFAGQYQGLAAPGTGLRLEDLVGPNKVADLSDLSDSANFGDPYATTVGPDGTLITGAFVPRRVEVDAQGRVTEVPIGFENGGDVPVQEGVGGLFSPEEQARMDKASQELDALRAQGGGGLFSPEEQARMAKIAAAEVQPDGSMPGVDTLRYATPEEVDVGAYNYQKDLEDKLLYHVKERDKVNPFEFMGISTDRKRFHQNQIEQVQKLIEDFRGQRGAAVANYRDYIAAGGRPLIVNTEEEPYFKSFPTDLINFRATKP